MANDVRTLEKRVSKLTADKNTLQLEVGKRAAAVERVCGELDAAGDVAAQLRLAQRRREAEADWADASRLLDATLAELESVSGQLDRAQKLEAFPARLRGLECLRQKALDAQRAFVKAAVDDLVALDEKRKALEQAAADAGRALKAAEDAANDELTAVANEAEALGVAVALPVPFTDLRNAAVGARDADDLLGRRLLVAAGQAASRDEFRGR